MESRKTLRTLLGTVVTTILLGSPVAIPRAVADGDFVALTAVELPFDVQARHDGAGALRLERHGRLLAEIELALMEDLPEPREVSGATLLGTARGARVLDRVAASRILHEGMSGGRRGSEADDDGDGSFDEDPADGLDNDGDGRVDEDFAAIGTAMHASRAALDAVGREGVTLHSELYHWGYYHVDGALFWNARLEADPSRTESVSGAAAVVLRSEHGVGLVERRVRAHSSVGKVPDLDLAFPRMRVDLDDGSRLYLGLLRLDGRSAVLSSRPGVGGTVVVWQEGSGTHWPIAVLVARTEESLLFLASQSLLTFDRAGTVSDPSQRWTVPPLCARCRQPQVDEVRIELGERGEQLRVSTKFRGAAELEMISHEGLRLADAPMGRWLVRAGRDGAVYDVPMRTALATRLVEAARAGSLRPEVWTIADTSARPREVAIELEGELSVAGAGSTAWDEAELPTYLSPRLVQSWPNPFRESTTIEVRVPETIEEAFDLEPAQRARVDLRAAPPFGSQPGVEVRVYNVGGQLIRTLEDDVHGPGTFTVTWDGNDLSGRAVAAGAYYVNVAMGDWSVTRRVLRLKP